MHKKNWCLLKFFIKGHQNFYNYLIKIVWSAPSRRRKGGKKQQCQEKLLWKLHVAKHAEFEVPSTFIAAACGGWERRRGNGLPTTWMPWYNTDFSAVLEVTACNVNSSVLLFGTFFRKQSCQFTNHAAVWLPIEQAISLHKALIPEEKSARKQIFSGPRLLWRCIENTPPPRSHIAAEVVLGKCDQIFWAFLQI